MPFGMGFGELVLILVIVMVVFGATKLPQLGDGLGRAIKNFKRSMGALNEIDVTPRSESRSETRSETRSEQTSDGKSETRPDGTANRAATGIADPTSIKSPSVPNAPGAAAK